jgi:hypothetical protein
MSRRKLKPDEIDWSRVRKGMRNSFTNRGDIDFDYCAAAFAADPERYKREGEEVRSEERAKVNPFG